MYVFIVLRGFWKNDIIFAKEWYYLILRIAYKKIQFCLTYIEPALKKTDRAEKTGGYLIVFKLKTQDILRYSNEL
jgi:hypothetical protein